MNRKELILEAGFYFGVSNPDTNRYIIKHPDGFGKCYVGIPKLKLLIEDYGDWCEKMGKAEMAQLF